MLDANESERLWSTLGRLNEQVANAVDVATATALKVERLERTMVAKSEHAGRTGARKGARNQDAIVAAIIGLVGAVANYYAAKSAALAAEAERPKIVTVPR